MKKREEAREKKPSMAGVGKSRGPEWFRCPDCSQMQMARWNPGAEEWFFPSHKYFPSGGKTEAPCEKKPENNVVEIPKRRTA